jgi:hypothetical protein
MIQQYQSERENVGIIYGGLLAHTATVFDRVKIQTPSGIRFQTEVEQAKMEKDFLRNHNFVDENTRRCMQCDNPLNAMQKRFCSIGCLARHNLPHLKKGREERQIVKVEPVIAHCANPNCLNTFAKDRKNRRQSCCCRACGSQWGHIKSKSKR